MEAVMKPHINRRNGRWRAVAPDTVGFLGWEQREELRNFIALLNKRPASITFRMGSHDWVIA